MAVLGFDNWAVVTQSSRPELSNVDMQLKEIRRTPANILFAAIADAEGPAVPGVGAMPGRGADSMTPSI